MKKSFLIAASLLTLGSFSHVTTSNASSSSSEDDAPANRAIVLLPSSKITSNHVVVEAFCMPQKIAANKFYGKFSGMVLETTGILETILVNTLRSKGLDQTIELAKRLTPIALDILMFNDIGINLSDESTATHINFFIRKTSQSLSSAFADYFTQAIGAYIIESRIIPMLQDKFKLLAKKILTHESMSHYRNLSFLCRNEAKFYAETSQELLEERINNYKESIEHLEFEREAEHKRSTDNSDEFCQAFEKFGADVKYSFHKLFCWIGYSVEADNIKNLTALKMQNYEDEFMLAEELARDWVRQSFPKFLDAAGFTQEESVKFMMPSPPLSEDRRVAYHVGQGIVEGALASTSWMGDYGLLRAAVTYYCAPEVLVTDVVTAAASGISSAASYFWR